MRINPKIAWSSYIWEIIKEKIDSSWDSILSFCDKHKLSRPTIDNILKWRTVWTKKTFDKLMDILNFSKEKQTDIYLSAKIQEIKIEFWDDGFHKMLKSELTKDEMIKFFSDYLK